MTVSHMMTTRLLTKRAPCCGIESMQSLSMEMTLCGVGVRKTASAHASDEHQCLWLLNFRCSSVRHTFEH